MPNRAAIAFAVFVSFAAALPLATAAPRLKAAKGEFVRLNPCPANGKTRRTCPGYVVDHIEPLCAGGADSPANMQWQTVAEAKLKDRRERAQCRQLRAGNP